MERITEVEVYLHPAEFMEFLRYIAKKEVSGLYFKRIDYPHLENATIGRLTFGVPGYKGHLWLREVGKGEEKGTRKIVLFLDSRSRFLPAEAKEAIKTLVFEALNRIAKRTPNYIVSFTTR